MELTHILDVDATRPSTSRGAGFFICENLFHSWEPPAYFSASSLHSQRARRIHQCQLRPTWPVQASALLETCFPANLASLTTLNIAMITDLDDMFIVLEEFDITMEQFMLPYILFLDQREYGENPLPRGNQAVAYIYRYSENVRPWPRKSIYDMVEKGLLKNYNESETVYPDNLEVTDKFAEAVFATVSDFEQFWQTYPAFTEKHSDSRRSDTPGASTPKGSISAGGTSEGDISESYIPLKACMKSEVQNLFEDHVQTTQDFEELMEALMWANKRDMVQMSIEKFLKAEYWKQIREVMGRAPDGDVHT